MEQHEFMKGRVAIANVSLHTWPFMARCKFLAASVLALLGFDATITVVTQNVIRIEEIDKFIKEKR